MSTIRIGLGLALLLTGSASAASAQAPTAARIEIPIKEVVLSNGTRRYTIPVRVGATTLQAGLDSGSTGLRLLPGAAAAADVAESRTHTTISYGSGAKLDGIVGTAVIALGDRSGSSPVELIRQVGCTAAKPQCPAGRVPLDRYGIQGDGLPGEGFKAIIGVNMAENEVPNPLVRLGARRWILELPRPGDAAPGRLVLDPSAEETAGYTMVSLDRDAAGVRGGLHDAIPACLVNRQTRQSICGPMLMDSGAPGVRVVAPRALPAWANDTPATLAILQGDKPVLAANFTVGRRAQASHLTTEVQPQAPGPRLFAGLLPYFAFSVLYDPGRGAIGLKPRDDISAH